MKKVILSMLLITVILMADKIKKDSLIPLSNLNNSTGVVFPNNKLRLIIKNESFTKDTMYNGSNQISHPKNSIVKMNITKFVVRYGLSKNFDIRFIIPYNNKEKSFTNPGNGNRIKLENRGFGDITIISRYRLMNQKKGDPFFFMIGAGVKLPTADTNKRFTDINIPAGGGGALPLGYRDPKDIMTMQLGTGSTDPIVEMGFTKFLQNSRIDTHIIHKFSQTGDHDYRFGDITKCGVGYAHVITSKLYWQLEYNYHIIGKNIYRGTTENQSGGEFGYITPGFHYKINKKLDFSLAYVKMVQRDNNYGSSKYEGNLGGLSEDNRMIFRLGYNF